MHTDVHTTQNKDVTQSLSNRTQYDDERMTSAVLANLKPFFTPHINLPLTLMGD